MLHISYIYINMIDNLVERSACNLIFKNVLSELGFPIYIHVCKRIIKKFVSDYIHVLSA